MSSVVTMHLGQLYHYYISLLGEIHLLQCNAKQEARTLLSLFRKVTKLNIIAKVTCILAK